MHFVAKSAEFTKEVYKNESVLSKFARNAKEKFKGIGSVLRKAFNVKALIGTVLGGAGLGALVRSTTEYSDKLVVAARVAGMGVTQFEKLREVLAGDGMGMEEAASATRRFSKRLGELRLLERGTFMKGVQDSLLVYATDDKVEKLWKTMKDESKGPLEVMKAMVEYASQTEMSAEKTAAFFDLAFGLQGRKMGQTLVRAVKDFGSFDKAMEHYGQFITLTAEEHEKNKDLNQQFGFLGQNVKDGVRKIMSNLSEPLTDMIEKFNNWILELKKSPEAAQGMIDAFNTIKDAVLIIAESIKAIHDWWQGAPEEMPQMYRDPNNSGRPTRVKPGSQSAEPEPPKAPYVNPLEGLDGAAMSGMSATEKILNDLAASSMTAGVGSAMAAPMPKWMSDPQGAVSGISAPLPGWESKSPIAESVSAQASSYPTGLGSSGGSMSSGSSVSDLLQPFADLRPSVEELNLSFRSMIQSFIDGESDFKSTMRGLLDAVMQRSLVDPAADWLSKGTDAFFGSLFPGRADGGLARGMTLVGERGPELVDFSKPGMVYSNEQLSAALNGSARGSTVINYNISSTDGPGVRAALAAATPSIVEAAQARVGEEADRPGGFRRAIRGGI